MYAKNYLLIFFTFFSISLLAQVTSDKQRNFRYGFCLTPKANWFLVDDKMDNQVNFASSGYGNIYYDVNAKLQLRSGIGLHLFTTNSLDYSPTFGCDFNGQGGADIYNSFYKFNVQSAYLGIPMDVKIKLFGDVNHLYLRFGLEYLFRLVTKDQVTLHECGGGDGIKQDNLLYQDQHKKKNIFLQTGFGYEWLTGSHKLFIEPLMSYGIFMVFEDEGITSTLITNGNSFQAGVLLGMIF